MKKIFLAKLMATMLMVACAFSLYAQKNNAPVEKKTDSAWRSQLDETFNWFSKNPPDKNGSNYGARRNKSVILDRYGWQLSSEIWSAYRLSWIKDLKEQQQLESIQPILYYLEQATRKSVEEIRATKVSRGAIIWKLYNMGYIVKTKDACFGIDINQPGSVELVDLLDFVIASHVHSDHNSPELLDAMTAHGKAVFSPFYTKGTLIDTERGFNFGEVKVRFTMNRQADVPVIVSQIDCGVSAHHFTLYHIGDSRSLIDLKPNRHVNMFILHIENALDISAAVALIKPDVTVYDHVMELGHPVGKYRWSYDFTYNKIKDKPHGSSYVLTWGEKLVCGR